jgi:hypothetical protein
LSRPSPRQPHGCSSPRSSSSPAASQEHETSADNFESDSYKFINDLSLGQRLKAIIAEFRADFGEVPAGFQTSLIRKLVDTRNYYTHFSDELRDRALGGKEMYWASRQIVLLLTVLFFRRLEVPAAEIKQLLTRHEEFQQLWVKFDPTV